MKFKSILVKTFSIMGLWLVVGSCAQIGSPTGGPKDVDPPVVLRSTPENQSTRYEGENIRIYFNEFVSVNELQKNLLVSPPLPNDPEIKIRGRSIIISVKDTLLPNTTYNFFLGEAIVDITESNPIPNFQFVVSTGDYVDSLSLAGRLRDAITLLPEPEAFIMLYRYPYDSVPMLEKPVYLTKTNDKGEFRINNMSEGRYLIFGLKDLNSNYVYDNPEERIAFIDTLVSPYYIPEPESFRANDSIPSDSLLPDNSQTFFSDSLDVDNNVVADTLIDPLADSLQNIQLSFPFYDMLMFTERDTLQRVVSSALASKGKINLVFRVPADSVTFRDLRNNLGQDWFISEFAANRDTLTLWIPKAEIDSVFLEVIHNNLPIDSVKLSMTPRATRGGGRGASRSIDETEVSQSISISNSASDNRNVQPYFLPFRFISASPLQRFDSSKVSIDLSDSIPVEFSLSFDDLVKRSVSVNPNLLPDSTYKILALPGAFTDIFGATNDTIKASFKVNNPEAYGTIIVVMDSLPIKNNFYLLQLVDEKIETVIDVKEISSPGTFTFNHLPAAKYKLRLIADENKNKKWDPGHYLLLKNPEPVYIYDGIIETRLNWEMEVLW